MDMMNSIASSAMQMSAAQFEQQYSISVQKKAMDVEELALQELQEMLRALMGLMCGPKNTQINIKQEPLKSGSCFLVIN